MNKLHTLFLLLFLFILLPIPAYAQLKPLPENIFCIMKVDDTITCTETEEACEQMISTQIQVPIDIPINTCNNIRIDTDEDDEEEDEDDEQDNEATTNQDSSISDFTPGSTGNEPGPIMQGQDHVNEFTPGSTGEQVTPEDNQMPEDEQSSSGGPVHQEDEN